MHALIIEDEPLIALLIEDQLRLSGYTSFDFAVSEAQAVASANLRSPDLVTSDVRLVEGCGIAAVEAICNGREIVVLFVTANVAKVRRRIRDATIVPKPFANGELRRAIAAARIKPRATLLEN